MKLILATILAGSFLLSLPVKADDKPAGDAPTVTFRPHAPTTLAALKAALHATSIADTY